MRPHTLIVLVFALLTPALSAAQNANRLPRALELPASTRAMALGNAYMMNAGHADAIFYHPALLLSARGFGLELQRWGGESSATAASGALQWLGGGVGIGLLTLQYGGPGPGNLAAPAGQDHLFQLGTAPVSERIAVIGYARELFGLDIGVAGKLVDERVDDARESVILVDVGAATDVGPIRVGLTVRDWGDDPIVSPADATPRVVLGAGAYGRPLGIFDIGASVAADWSDDRASVSGGLEVGYWPISGRTFVARIGFQDPVDGSEMSPVSFGLAFWGDNVTAEWAFRPYDGSESSGTHRFGLRWR
jgi:hypothetical protein